MAISGYKGESKLGYLIFLIILLIIYLTVIVGFHYFKKTSSQIYPVSFLTFGW